MNLTQVTGARKAPRVVEPSVKLLRECRREAFVDAAVDQLDRLVTRISLTAPTAVAERTLANLVVRHRLVRTKLERHKQLAQGVL